MPSFSIRDRRVGEVLPDSYPIATEAEIDEAVVQARHAFPGFRELGLKRATFIRAIADALESRREAIVLRAMAETALPEARLNGELNRTANQLRMFASILEDGAWQDVRIDPAAPDRTPPAPDTRSMLRPLGPVAVFGASNFPLAFSVAGGDTASALAAGCPVIVKAHPAHPGTSALAAEAIREAAGRTGMPSGVFSILFDDGFRVGEALVKHPHIKAVGFTGSRRGGLALWRLANERPEPIPVYAEMGSINPVVVLPGKLNAEFAAGLQASVTLGVGQFCTNPGLVLMLGSPIEFLGALVKGMRAIPACPMLTDSIASAYLDGAERLAAVSRVLVEPTEAGAPGVFEVEGRQFIGEPRLQEEVFGPSTLLVACADRTEALRVIECLEGQLVGSIHGSDDDLAGAQDLVDALEEKVGRLVINQFPTGVEVNRSIVHGGPWPATTDSRTTSVGSRAILRWVRPICYQNFPDHLLPVSLQVGATPRR